MSLRKLNPSEQLSMKECDERLEIVTKIYNRFTTKQIKRVLHDLYINRIVTELVVDPEELAKAALVEPKRKYTKKVKAC